MKWVDVVGYDGLYQVSDTGLVKSYDKIRFGEYYKIKRRFYPSRILRACKGRDYLIVRLTKDRKVKTFTVHRLVALAFIPNPDNKPNVNHIDFNPENNNVSNLEWCTQFENIHHTMRAGRDYAPSGEDNYASKFTEAEVKKILKMAAKGYTQKAISETYNVHQSTISYMVNGKTWKHIER